MQNELKLQKLHGVMTSDLRNSIRRTLLWVRHQQPSVQEIDHVLKTLDFEDSIYFLRKFTLEDKN